MAFWLCLILGIIAGAFAGGFKALKQARDHEFEAADRLLRRGALVAALTALVMCAVLLKYPFRDTEISVTEEVTKTVIETVEVPVRVGRWFLPEWFFPRTEIREQEVEKPITQTITRQVVVRRFSFLLLLPMALLACLAYYSELVIVRLFWRGIPGLRWLQRQ